MSAVQQEANSIQTLRLHSRIDGGDQSGVPTILVHGVGSDLTVWDDIAPALSKRHPVIRYDLRGHGRSPDPKGPYSLDDFVDDHINLLKDLGFKRVNLIGSSLGGLIAQGVALKYPETVDKLVILSAVAGRTPEEERAALERLALVETEGLETVVEKSMHRWYTPGFIDAHPDAVSRHRQRFVSNDLKSYAAAYRVLATSDLGSQLLDIKAPTLIMTGSHDVGSPPHMSQFMANRIPDSKLVIVDGVKHAMLQERPQQVVSEVLSFLPERLAGQESNGMSVRRAVLSDEYVNKALARQDFISVEFQEFITQYCWDEIWTDDRLSRREHSLLTLGMTAALGRMAEFEAHTLGALRNGVEPDQLAAILKQITVYCGVPAGVGAAAAIRKVLEAQASNNQK